MKRILLLAAAGLVFSLAACQNITEGERESSGLHSATSSSGQEAERDAPTADSTPAERAAQPDATAGEADRMRSIQLVADGKIFSAKLYNNDAARLFSEKLPLTLDMSELNGNEKYGGLSAALPEKPIRPPGIRAGEIMLYGSDCLVLFYKNFSTAYRYTPLGYVEDADGFAAAAGKGSVRVTFQ